MLTNAYSDPISPKTGSWEIFPEPESMSDLFGSDEGYVMTKSAV